MTVRFLIIEGADSTGKTTLARELKKSLDKSIEVEIINDLNPVQKHYFSTWLARYVKDGWIKELDPVSQAALFAVAARQNKLEYPKDGENKLFILDRSVISSLLYASAMLYKDDFYNYPPFADIYDDIKEITLNHLNDDDADFGELHRTLRSIRTTYFPLTKINNEVKLTASAVIFHRDHVYPKDTSATDPYEDPNMQLIVKSFYSYYLRGHNLVAETSVDKEVKKIFGGRAFYELSQKLLPFFRVDDGVKFPLVKTPIITSFNGQLDEDVRLLVRLIGSNDFWQADNFVS
ncbi:nucleoside/nucleotide kinase family protein [Psittacicella hinzii]|uniref:Thymidylate kinase-like domain-containing protein n=1 Tax=Psittacicella hinzii TaxID=2028575 RepID=A0A3A1YQE1_9GAMM|nr:AAA family ATPase [Psittacicella hinzii]RIY39469.1 hypothetical protein CKF58_02070 [Psittacicella hinzii]